MPRRPLTVAEKKSALRIGLRYFQQELTPAQRLQKSKRIWAQVERHPAFKQAQTVLLYSALPDEPESLEFMERWRTSKQILLPIVKGKNLAVGNIDELRSVPPFGILEPRQALSEIPNIDLVIVPALAYDHEGYRLGRGKGYYDRFLPTIKAFSIGVCFDFQLIDDLPHEEWDVRVGEVISDVKLKA